jgi:hypothetical protein
MKKSCFLLICFSFLCFIRSEAQGSERFFCPVFDSVIVTQDIVYGINASILDTTAGEAIPQSLFLDLYKPYGDTEDARPLVLIFHSGNFQPFPENLQSTGTFRDSAVVDLATKLAKRGFVAASCTYRLGWNQDTIEYLWFNALYRGIQDARTAIRFFKKSVAIDNEFAIDSSKIVVWGMGASGGSISIGCASLDDWVSEIAMLPKFNTIAGNPPLPVPVVNSENNGDLYGTSVGIAPIDYPLPEGDTLCYPNHVGYSSDFQMAVSMGGSVGDTSWIDSNSISTVSLHVPTDQVVPYKIGLEYLFPTDSIFIEKTGNYYYQKMMKKYSNQEEWYDFDWDSFNWSLDLTDIANSRNDGLEGLFPVRTVSVENNAPWDWWSTNIQGQFGPPDPVTAKITIDSALNYFTPRACITLDLGCDFTIQFQSSCGVVDVVETNTDKFDLTVSPIPAMNYVHFSTKKNPMQRVQIYYLTGRLVKEHNDVNSYQFELQRGNLGNGVYFAKVWFEDGFLSKQIIFQD